MTARIGRIRVAMNGYGVIGKRVADAVARQGDMELVEVADVGLGSRIRVAAERRCAICSSTSEQQPIVAQAGIPVAVWEDARAVARKRRLPDFPSAQ